jgi:hypothetical protein
MAGIARAHALRLAPPIRDWARWRKRPEFLLPFCRPPEGPSISAQAWQGCADALRWPVRRVRHCTHAENSGKEAAKRNPPSECVMVVDCDAWALPE